MSQLALVTGAMDALLASTYTQLGVLASADKGLGARSGTVFVLILVTFLAAVTWGEAKVFTLALSWGAFLCVLFWWLMFVSIAYRVATKANLRLTPRLCLVVGLLVLVVWLALALLLTTALFLGRWFFVGVLAVWLAMSISGYRKILLPLAVLGIALACWFPITRQGWHMPYHSVLDQMRIIVGMWAVAGGFIALIGVTRVFPLLGGALWVLWVGSAMLSKSLTGLRFNELLSAIYAVGGQTTTHVVTAIVLFGLMSFGILLKPRRAREQTALLDGQVIRRGQSGESPWQRLVATLPGYDYFLARATRQPYQFTRLLPLSFGRSVHAASLIWILLGYGLLAALMVWANALTMRGIPPEFDRLSVMVLSLFFSFTLVLPLFLIAATYRARRSHQLLCLTPGWPDVMIVNRELAGMYARLCGIVALAGLVPIGIVVVTRGMDIQSVWCGVLALLALGALQFSAPLHRYDTGDSMTVRSGILAWNLAIAVLSAAFVFGFVTNRIPLWGALIALVVCAAIAYFRYRRFVSFERTIPAAPSNFG